MSGSGVPRPGAETAGDATKQPEGSASPMDEVRALAALLEPEAFDPDVPAAPEWRERAQNSAVGYAARAIDAGYRRVVVDDTTVDRVARAMWEDHCRSLPPFLRDVDEAEHEAAWADVARLGHFHVQARAAVRSVLGEDQP